MPYLVCIAVISIIALGPGRAAAADVEAVAPGGPGVLTICRDWLLTHSCKTYQHIDLPPRIAVGDTVTLTFGSNPKEYEFPVARIVLKDRHCTLFSQAAGNPHAMDKINLARCRRASEGR
ncbi:MAG: hypothetical protein J2P48_15240 [Alphaproteobacteria bacterium]|nr:hypothetical protein [Alphaproteobacteria bacterium]